MMELPEAVTIAAQLDRTILGKRIASVTAGHTPHKFAWFYGDPKSYGTLLVGKTVGKAGSFGGMVEIKVGAASVLFAEGAAVRFHSKSEPRPAKHQFLVEFHDGSAVSASVQMYGGMGAFLDNNFDNPYYKIAKEKPSPLSAAFDTAYFHRIVGAEGAGKLSLKALLATEQRIPGLGNGVLQDILFNARMHPKKKVGTLSDREERLLFDSVKATLSAMATQGGRDTELDLFGRPGGYKTLLSKSTGKPCPVCGTLIKKEAHLGGAIYFCAKCQRV